MISVSQNITNEEYNRLWWVVRDAKRLDGAYKILFEAKSSLAEQVRAWDDEDEKPSCSFDDVRHTRRQHEILQDATGFLNESMRILKDLQSEHEQMDNERRDRERRLRELS